MLDLAQTAEVSVSTVKRMEMAEPPPISDQVYETVRATLGRAGVQFLDDDGDGPGVRLRAP